MCGRGETSGRISEHILENEKKNFGIFGCDFLHHKLFCIHSWVTSEYANVRGDRGDSILVRRAESLNC
jgi:hypothetical protein